MKDLIEKKLEEHGKSVIEKDNLTMDDINFLIYLLNRIESKEALRISKENEEMLKVQQAESNKAWKEHMYAMLENINGR